MAGQRYQQLSDAATSYVRELIIKGELVSGDFLRLDRLAEELNMSVTPVREGLLRLRGMGMVQLAPRRGFVVLSVEPDDIRDVFVAQGLLAGELACRAASRLSAADLVQLNSYHELMKEEVASKNDADEIEQLNHQFHRLINSAASAPKVSGLLRVGTQYVPGHFFSSRPGWVASSIQEHARILRGLNKRDPEAARAKMYDHIVHAGELLATHLAERRAESSEGISATN